MSGSNTYTFGYTPLQSLADEAWGLDDKITADAVPAPAALALLLGGFGLAGLGALRRARV